MPKTDNILIVDDEVDFCRLISIFLARENFEIQYVHCLKDAEFLLQSNKPHVIILDHNLPDGLGLDFLIKKPELFNYSHVILVSADPSPKLKFRAFNAGIHFLGKPLEMKKIKEMIKMVA